MNKWEEDAGLIHPLERDSSLGLEELDWQARLIERLGEVRGWRESKGRVTRDLKKITRSGRSATFQQAKDQECASLNEIIIRFPSAPIYSIHRRREYQYRLAKRSNYHTLRVIRRPTPKGAEPEQLERLYVLHNGLNEVDRLNFYYELADYLLDPRSACILRPFPGHLTRSPFPLEYAETPLDRYLADAGDLFRQFLRFMLESQWFLSIIAPLPFYGVIPGVELLAPSGAQATGDRSETETLLKAILESWRMAYDYNDEQIEKGDAITQESVRDVIEGLRSLVGWRKPTERQPETIPSPENLRPSVHVVGYSIGGYVAQSVFFAWPYAVASCSPMFAGGALREISPTAFAHREEWQTVMHSLRYELESSMLEQRIRRDTVNGQETIAGVNANHYAFFDRMFNDVFLQDSRSFYRSRVSEYRSRMFFVMSGADPVISMESLLQSTPEKGIIMIVIPDVPHLPFRAGSEWKGFWFKEVAHILRRFARETTEGELADTLAKNWWTADYTRVL